MVCAALLWDRLITPERAVMPFYAEFSDAATPAALISTVALDASLPPQSVSLVPQNGAAALLKPKVSPYRAIPCSTAE